MTTDSTAQQERAAAWHQLRPSQAVRCPRTVAGKRCRTRNVNSIGQTEPCICNSTLMDHARMWIGRDGQKVLTTEPYGRDGMDVADFIRELDAIGLSVEVTGASPWNPGATFCLMIWKSP